MALRYKYDEVIGHCIVNIGGEKKALILYEGNAYLIAVYEFRDDDGQIREALQWFFADKEHAKKCLGVSKGSDNIFNEGYFDSVSFDNPQNSRYMTDLIKLLLKAFPNLKITIN